MEPLTFLLATTLVVSLIGRVWVPSWRPWPVAVRGGVTVMFLATGTSHFVGMRAELIEMVPPALPAPGALVTLTGVLEIAGALALFVLPLRHWAAGGLALLLIAMFPANVHHALTGTDLRWDDTLLPRTVLQLVFLAAVLIVLVAQLHDFRRDRAVPPALATPARDPLSVPRG